MESKVLNLGKFELLLAKLDKSNWSNPESYSVKKGFGKGWRFPSPDEFRYIAEINRIEILPEDLIITSSPYWTNFHLPLSDLEDLKDYRLKKEIEEYIEGELEDGEIRIQEWTAIVEYCYLTIGGYVHELYNFEFYDGDDGEGDYSTFYPSANYLLVRDIK
jgi:hypothetical protein